MPVPKLDSQFIIKYQGKDFATYQGLLDLAHQIGLQSIMVEIVQIPNKDNEYVAVCQAKATTTNGEVFIEIGDASPKNVTPLIAKHILRMAATRAKARALRDLTNVGLTAIEEIDKTEHREPQKTFAELTQDLNPGLLEEFINKYCEAKAFTYDEIKKEFETYPDRYLKQFKAFEKREKNGS